MGSVKIALHGLRDEGRGEVPGVRGLQGHDARVAREPSDVGAQIRVAAPTDAEVSAFYRQNAQRFGGSETRVLSQVILPTQGAAQQFAQRLASGTSFVDAARTAGFSAADIAAELGQVGPRADLDFSGFVFEKAVLHECNYNWKTFIEVYLEDYHVAPFHPGLGSFVTCSDLRWEFGAEHSVQTVGVVLAWVACVAAGALFHHAVETPIRRWQGQAGSLWLRLATVFTRKA